MPALPQPSIASFAAIHRNSLCNSPRDWYDFYKKKIASNGAVNINPFARSCRLNLSISASERFALATVWRVTDKSTSSTSSSIRYLYAYNIYIYICNKNTYISYRYIIINEISSKNIAKTNFLFTRLLADFFFRSSCPPIYRSWFTKERKKKMERKMTDPVAIRS